KGYIYFEPGKELNEDSSYYVELRGGIKDEEGFTLEDTIQIHFTTLAKPAYNFLVLDAVDSLTQWSVASEPTDSAEFSFSLASDRKVSGNFAARLNYKFNNSLNGKIEILLNEKINVTR